MYADSSTTEPFWLRCNFNDNPGPCQHNPRGFVSIQRVCHERGPVLDVRALYPTPVSVRRNVDTGVVFSITEKEVYVRTVLVDAWAGVAVATRIHLQLCSRIKVYVPCIPFCVWLTVVELSYASARLSPPNVPYLGVNDDLSFWVETTQRLACNLDASRWKGLMMPSLLPLKNTA